MRVRMRTMKTITRIVCIIGTLCLLAEPLSAQENALASEDMTIMTMMFGTNQCFSATLVLTVTPKGEKQGEVTEHEYAFAKGDVRMEDDLTRKPGRKPKVIEALKKEGLERLVYILRPEKHVAYMLVPGKKVYTVTELPPAVDVNAPKAPKVERKELGKETIEGHPCVKKRVTVTREEGDPVEYVTWDATDLGNLPIRFQCEGEETTELVVLKNIKLGKLDPSVFEVPATYKKLSEQEAADLVMAVMQLEMFEDYGPTQPHDEPQTVPKKP